MNDQELIEKYQNKLATQIWLTMRKAYPGKKVFTLEDLSEKLKKAEGQVSRELKRMAIDGLIKRQYTYDANGPRLRVSLTKKGLRLGQQRAYEWLNKKENSLLKGLSVVMA